ncbi:MAG: FitA-like ribbon-helix-helix domain-containing protein [Gammaproteobacteria bacterium]
MPVNLSIKNVPDDLAQALREQAARNHRSLQGELMSLLVEAVRAGGTLWPPPAQRTRARPLTVEEAAELARGLFPGGTQRSVDLIRQDRDERAGVREPRDE